MDKSVIELHDNIANVDVSDQSNIPFLIEALATDFARDAAVKLSEYGEEAVSPLLEAIKDHDKTYGGYFRSST